MWEQESPSSFRSASFESRTGKPDVYWEFVLSQVGEGDKFALDVYRNREFHASIQSDALTELHQAIFEKTDRISKHKDDVRNFVATQPSCHNFPLTLPITLQPNYDFMPVNTGWKRVPANGYRYEKIREGVDDNDGDATYIYDDGGTQTEIGFEPPPVGAPSTYTTVTARIAVKNISNTPTIAGKLRIVVPGQSVREADFTSSGLSTTNYEVVEWSWTDVFTVQEIAYLRIRLNAVAGVNRVSAIELVLAEEPLPTP